MSVRDRSDGTGDGGPLASAARAPHISEKISDRGKFCRAWKWCIADSFSEQPPGPVARLARPRKAGAGRSRHWYPRERRVLLICVCFMKIKSTPSQASSITLSVREFRRDFVVTRHQFWGLNHTERLMFMVCASTVSSIDVKVIKARLHYGYAGPFGVPQSRGDGKNPAPFLSTFHPFHDPLFLTPSCFGKAIMGSTAKHPKGPVRTDS